MDRKESVKKIYNNLKTMEYVKSDLNKEIAIYIHIPFCEKKCNYCSFVSFCNKFDKLDDYINTLCKEIDLRRVNNYIIKSIYIGGGTPSLLSIEQLNKIFSHLRLNYTIKDDAEITIELNPNSVEYDKLLNYKKLGINRISLGVQSLSNKKLKLLGRVHSKKQALQALKLISSVGFDNVSADLIISLPKQSRFEIARHIKKLSKYVTHFSIYSLSIEENTQFFDLYNKNLLKLPSENKSAKLYMCAFKKLKRLGFNRYEVSNFSKTGFESKHNLTYWEMGEYLGLGLASHSYLFKSRMANTEDFEKYLTLISKSQICYTTNNLSDSELIEEFIMLGLRTSMGIDLNILKSAYNYDLKLAKKQEIALLNDLGLITVSNNKIKATDKGILVLNQIIIKLI